MRLDQPIRFVEGVPKKFLSLFNLKVGEEAYLKNLEIRAAAILQCL